MAEPQWWPLDEVRVTGPWANSPAYYAQFGQLGHNGIDLAASMGTPVYATDDGVVHVEGWNIPWSGTAGGIAAIIRHAWGYSGYAHLNSTIINANQSVARGQLIGYSGMTGIGTGPHLHFETLPPGVNFANGFSGRVNPTSIINLQPRGTASPGPSPEPEKKDDDMARILQMRSTTNHRDPNATQKTIYFDGPAGIKGIQNETHLGLLSRYIADRPGDQMYPHELATINTYLAPDMPVLSQGTVEAAVRKVLKELGTTPDAQAVANAVEAALEDDFAAISGATADKLAERLKS